MNKKIKSKKIKNFYSIEIIVTKNSQDSKNNKKV